MNSEEKHTNNSEKDTVILTGKQYLKLVDEVKQEFERRYENKVIIDKEEYNKVDNVFKMSIADHIAYLRENERLKEDVAALIGTRFNRFNLITQEESDNNVKQVVSELLNHLKRRKLVGEYELGRIAERYNVTLEE